MSRRALLLFAAVGVLWGIPYLLIKVALDELRPMDIVFLRCAIGALLLVPIAWRRRSLGPALRAWPWVLAFALIEIAVPWLLLSDAETRVSSGFAGLFLATVPLVGAIVARFLGDHSAVAGRRLTGIGLGLAGVVALAGLDSLAGHVDGLSVLELAVVAVGYAVAPAMAVRRLGHVESMAVIGLSFVIVASIYAVPSLSGLTASPLPSSSTIAAILALGVLCSALAFLLFFRLILEVGAARATVVTFVNPAVAVLLGAVVLSEPLTIGTLLGFPLVLAGSWLATRAGDSPKADEPGTSARDDHTSGVEADTVR